MLFSDLMNILKNNHLYQIGKNFKSNIYNLVNNNINLESFQQITKKNHQLMGIQTFDQEMVYFIINLYLKYNFKAHFLNEDVSKRIAHSLASKQLIQISTGGGIDKNLGALLNMMQTTKATNLTQNLAPQKNFDNSTKTKSQYEEIKIYPNPKFQLEHHEMNLTTTGSYVKANSELMKSFEGDIGMDKGMRIIYK